VPILTQVNASIVQQQTEPQVAILVHDVLVYATVVFDEVEVTISITVRRK
jgi:hypothetical protein